MFQFTYCAVRNSDTVYVAKVTRQLQDHQIRQAAKWFYQSQYSVAAGIHPYHTCLISELL